MVIPASHCEAILRGMSKRADKEGDWIEVKFQIHPQQVPAALWNADLRSRWQLAFVEIGDDEQPVQKQPHGGGMAGHDADEDEKPKHKPASTRAEKARRLCGVAEFQAWAFKQWDGDAGKWPLDERYPIVSDWVKKKCQVSSKSQLDQFPENARLWDALLADYEQQTGRMASRHG